MTQEHREVERKLRVHELFRLPELTGLGSVASVEGHAPFTMRNEYYDTADLTLFRWGMTLRQRIGGHDAGWHLKVPVAGAGEGVRDEIRFPPSPEPPEQLVTLVTAFTRGKPLEPIVTLQTQRTTYLLKDSDGILRGELVDDTVDVLRNDDLTNRFREIEVEAVADESGTLDEDFIDAVVEGLITVGAEPSSMSKAAAGLGPRALVSPEVPALEWPDKTAPTSDAVRAYLTTHLRRLIWEDLRLRRDLPDAVHQMRVSARRLRSGLKAFAPLLEGSEAERLRAELGWFASELGGSRDTEVLQARLDAHAAQLPEHDARLARAVVDAALGSAADHAQVGADQLLASPRYTYLLTDLVSFTQQPPFRGRASHPIATVFPDLVGESIKRLEHRVQRLNIEGPAHPWHRARIAAKQARYVTEAAALMLGRSYGDLAKRLVDVTDVLGSHQDAAVAQDALTDMAQQASGPEGLALGRLFDIELAAEMADRVAFSELWPRVEKAVRRVHI